MFLLCCVGIGSWWLAGAGAAAPTFGSGNGASAPSVAGLPLSASPGDLLEGGLVVAEAQPLLGDQSVAEAEDARLHSPAAVVAREASRTRYEGLDSQSAAAVAFDAFPVVVGRTAGGPPQLPAGQRVVGFPSDNAALIALSDGRKAVVESVAPMAIEGARRREAINLGLTSVVGGFRASAPLVDVVIPRHVGDGVSLPGAGVSLTPVDGSGRPLGGSEGSIDGATVIYANAQLDTDIVVKPTTMGFAADAILRGEDSPSVLNYRVGLPRGATLVQDRRGGSVRVLKKGVTLARILAPSAQDAAGTPVPVSMRVEGDRLALVVDERSGEYEAPIEVDPEVVDESLGLSGSGKTSNWVFKPSNASIWGEEVTSSQLAIASKAAWNGGEYGLLNYSTRGESRIYYFEADVSGPGTRPAEESIHIINSGKTVEAGAEQLLNPTKAAYSGWFAVAGACTKGSCQAQSEKGSFENTAQYGVWTTGASGCCSTATMSAAKIYIAQEKAPEVSVSTASEIDGKHNALYGSGSWIGPHSGNVFEVKAHDPGIGLSQFSVEAYNTGGWNEYLNFKEYKGGERCGGVQCEPSYSPVYGYVSSMPNGEYDLVAKAVDAVGLKGEVSPASGVKLKVDSSPPSVGIPAGLGAPREIAEGEYTLTDRATDGEGSTKSSGVKEIQAFVDGRELGKANGACSPGPCTAEASWAINGAEFGVGEHRLTITATDNAGNVASETYTFKVHHATPVALGPGMVNPESGEFSMSANDASILVPGGSLTVSRAYRSRHVTAGAEGPLGPQWAMSVGGQESITVAAYDNVATLTSSTGGQTTFTVAGSGTFTSPEGDSNLALSEVKNEKGEAELLLKDAADGATTRFSYTGISGNEALWKPFKQEGPLPSLAVRYTYETVEGVSRPREALAPEPVGVSCGKELKELKAGCRALGFEYASATTATGEEPSEWGAYKGRLKEVLYYAYNPATKEIKPIVVAEYRYDSAGRLRAEWNPQISPVLKTTYGYDAEGHLTSVNEPGQEPWLLHYGTLAGDANPGRLLSVIRPAAAAPNKLKEADENPAPTNTSVPTLSTEAKVGIKISVSGNGTWSNEPLAYSYQWEDCEQNGKGCIPIPGAVNQSYYPVKSDHGHELVAEVSAVNANGSVTAPTAASELVREGTPSSPAPEPPAVGTSSVWTVEYDVSPSGNSELPELKLADVGQKDDPAQAAAIFPPDTPMGWPAKSYGRATVEYVDAEGRIVNVYTPTGGLSTTEYNKYNDVVRTLSPDNRAAALKEPCEGNSCKSAELAKLLSTESTYEEKGSEPGTELLSTLGPQHTVQLTSGTQVEAREHTVYSYNEGEPASGGPYDLVTKTTESAVVAGVEEPESVRTTKTGYSGTGTQENLGWKLRKPTSVTTDPGGLNLVHVTEYEPSTGEVSETKLPAATGKDAKVPPAYGSAFGAKGSGVDELKEPNGIALDPSGNVWVADRNNQRLDKFNAKGEFVEAIGFGVANGKEEPETCTTSCEAGISGATKGQFYKPEGIAFSASNFYVSEKGNDRVQEFNEKDEAIATFGEKGTAGGDFKEPDGIAVDSAGNVWVVDYANNRVEKFSAKGVFDEAIGFGVANGKEEYETCTSSCRAGTPGTGKGQFYKPQGIAFYNGELYVTDSHNNRVEEFNEAGSYLGEFGTAGTGNGQLETPTGITGSSATGGLYVVDEGNDRVEAFSAAGEYKDQFAEKGAGNGQLKGPEGIALNSSGDVYVADSANGRIEQWVPTITGNEGAHDTKTIYYTTAANTEFTECGGHQEWAGLVCETRPAAQPGTSGLSALAITKVTGYNVWDEPT
ncbi:MAG TPA: SMP-30/gluconolactonase/LRE family protein, partial [Solirubrobacteraceae bacterium]|nr:SMP-30/gluconolactonase/LRE family protein [Solirubrobacteraceae bacterium]